MIRFFNIIKKSFKTCFNQEEPEEIEEVNKIEDNNSTIVNDEIKTDIKIKISKPDLKNTTIVPEVGMYNPMANIEEPPMPPDGLIFFSTNTDSFNNNQLSLNNWRNQNTDFNTRGEGTDSVI